MFDYIERLRLLRAALGSNRLDAFVTSFTPHLRYLTGFTGSNGLAIVTQSRLYFLTDFRYKEQIRSEVSCSRSFITSGVLFEKAAGLKLLRGCKRVGFEEEQMAFANFRELKKNFKGIRFIPMKEMVEDLTSCKDREEVVLIKKAISITDTVYSEILKIVKPGVSELDLSAEISYLHKKHGAEKDSFEPIVVSGVRGSLPHGRPSAKKIKRGEMVTFDLGCVYRGYCSDLTRTIAVGKPSAQARKVYGIVLDAQQRSVDAARSGISARSLDGIARGHIHTRGFGKYFGHGLGHGIGIQIHEYPRISTRSTDTLRAGNVITIEPGIYLPGKFGVRIEDDILVRNDGCDVLTKSPRALTVV